VDAAAPGPLGAIGEEPSPSPCSSSTRRATWHPCSCCWHWPLRWCWRW